MLKLKIDSNEMGNPEILGSVCDVLHLCDVKLVINNEVLTVKENQNLVGNLLKALSGDSKIKHKHQDILMILYRHKITTYYQFDR